MQRKLSKDKRINTQTLWDQICCCFRIAGHGGPYKEGEVDLESASNQRAKNFRSDILDKPLFELHKDSKEKDQPVVAKSFSLKDLLQMDENVLNQLLFRTSIVIQGMFIHESHQDITQTRIVKV